MNNQSEGKLSATASGCGGGGDGGGQKTATVLARKSNPCDLLKNLKSVDKKGQKKPTILEQAAQDWNRSKAEEKLEDELKQATKSKTGYLDKQRFLERADLRQFEREREIRDQVRTRAARAQVHCATAKRPSG